MGQQTCKRVALGRNSSHTTCIS